MALGRVHRELAGGPDLKTALEQVVVAMFGYMTNLNEVELDDEARSFIEVEGDEGCAPRRMSGLRTARLG